MNSIATRFSLVVGAFAMAFSVLVLHRAWLLTKQHSEELTSVQAKMALEFDLAIREYVKDSIRPEMEKLLGEDEFIVEAMSTSYVARKIVERVREEFPGYLLKFPSDNPRNPRNKAGPEEERLIQHFQEHPEDDRWTGRLRIDGTDYYAFVSAMRVEESCLRCHGRPEDSPESLLAIYGPTGGFYREVGDVAGMDMIAIPTELIHASLASHARRHLLVTAGWLVLLFAAILIAFRWIVTRRLAAISGHFQVAAARESGALEPVPESGADEISVLAKSFNSLANRLRTLHDSLEEQVRDRTEDLFIANEHLRGEIDNRREVEEALRREQRLLKRSLQTHDHERQVIAYEIHDGLAQKLVGAIMSFQAVDLPDQQSAEESSARYRTGMEMLTECLAEARRLISGVRPPLLDEEGTVAAVQNLLSELENPDGPEIDFRHPAVFGRFEPMLENAIYRIVQEAVTNALRHSHSDQIQVSLEQQPDHVTVEVRDWGVGFEVTDRNRRGVGLKGIRDRAKFLGGTATIESKPGEGTRIVARIPLTPPLDDSDDSDY